jgi:60 kDa SS-A/Ro ribonucleoprotein
MMKNQIDPLVQARRFIILGSAGPTYYSAGKELTLENAMVVVDLIESGRGGEVLELVHKVSTEGLAAKQSPTLFVLAMLTRCKDTSVRSKALSLIPAICRTFAMLAEFITYHELGMTAPKEGEGSGTGWGSLRKAITKWFEGFGPQGALFQCLKYRNRHGWTPRDFLRKAHSLPKDPEMNSVYRYLTKADGSIAVGKIAEFIRAYEAVQNPETSEAVSVALVKEHRFAHEHLGNHLLKSTAVWTAMIENGMPINALLRNLGRLTANKTLLPFEATTDAVVERITNDEVLARGKVHPFQVLLAKTTYEQGKGEKGNMSWDPLPNVVEALEYAFYQSFKNVTPTGKNIVVGLDVSGSMHSYTIANTSITAAAAAAAMTMVFVRTEPKTIVKAFSRTLVDMPISGSSSLKEVMNAASRIPYGSTNCAAPIEWAYKNNVTVHAFVIITDNECNTGQAPTEALRKYRERVPNAKLCVIGMTSTGFSIADPDDKDSLDFIGFDSSAPRTIELFMRDEL